MTATTTETNPRFDSGARTDRDAFAHRYKPENASWTTPLPPDEPSENATRFHDRPPELTEVLDVC
jgi:hypothetical protein